MKVWAVLSGFHGTFAECTCDTLHSIWLDEDMARAVAEAGYLHSVESYEIETILPKYAEEVYVKIKKEKQSKRKKGD